MADWLISDIDDVAWERFKAKARAEGKTEEQLMLELVDDYVKDWEPNAVIVKNGEQQI